VVGLTSPPRVDFVEGTGIYDRVVPYGEIGSLPAARAVYVDMSGDADVRRAVHAHYGDSLVHSSAVGATHHDRMGNTEGITGPQPIFFFAPDRAVKRGKDWGRDELGLRIAQSWRPFVKWTTDWLQVIHGHGAEEVERVYRELLDGRVDPSRAHVLSMRS
jgi:Protein of unknown function (DUF2855)